MAANAIVTMAFAAISLKETNKLYVGRSHIEFLQCSFLSIVVKNLHVCYKTLIIIWSDDTAVYSSLSKFFVSI